MLKVCVCFGFLLLAKATNGQMDCDDSRNFYNSYCLDPEEFCIENSSPPKGLDDNTLMDYIVSQHNIRRSNVAAGGELQGFPGPQPASSCMNKLQWNTELAKSAQNWANQCNLTGYADRNLGSGVEPQVGQNVHALTEDSSTDPFDSKNYNLQLSYVDQAIAEWYGEVTKFDQANVEKYTFVRGTSRYTQFVWGRTKLIGCGFRRWLLDDGTDRFARILVCHYWPAGNKAKTPVYTTLKVKKAVCNTRCGSAPVDTFLNTKMNGRLCSGPHVSTGFPTSTPTPFTDGMSVIPIYSRLLETVLAPGLEPDSPVLGSEDEHSNSTSRRARRRRKFSTLSPE